MLKALSSLAKVVTSPNPIWRTGGPSCGEADDSGDPAAARVGVSIKDAETITANKMNRNLRNLTGFMFTSLKRTHTLGKYFPILFLIFDTQNSIRYGIEATQ